jgi:hypothetical protein
MVDGTLRSIYSAADETVAELDRLNQKAQAQRAPSLRRLEAQVARLDVGPGTVDDEPSSPPPRSERDGDRPRVTADRPDPVPFVPLPRRNTPGGPWGPAMVEKLTSIALEKQSRRW